MVCFKGSLSNIEEGERKVYDCYHCQGDGSFKISELTVFKSKKILAGLHLSTRGSKAALHERLRGTIK